MASLLSVPPELLLVVFHYLGRPDLKRFRCGSYACADLVTQLLFDEVQFDLEPGGCDNLISIARHTELRRHIRKLHLTRRRGLKGFDSFNSWEAATIYQYGPLVSENEQEQILPDVMSHDGWSRMGTEARERLYEAYLAEQRAVFTHISDLAATIVSLPGPTLDPVSPTATRLADQMAYDFSNAVHALTNVTTFTYTPAYEEDAAWGNRWHHIQFHRDGLAGNGNDEYDADCDALQLFVALCTVSSAPNRLQSINLYTKGYAFWGLPYLHRLLHWPKCLEDRDNMLLDGSSFYDEGFNGDDQCLSIYTGEIGGTLAFMQRTEALTRQLVTWEHHYSRLARLECRVDTLWMERPSSLLTAATELSNGLKLATGLEELNLVFRADAIADELGGSYTMATSTRHKFQPRRACLNQPRSRNAF
ncbi:hypothetical protein LTR56_027936 [Elasticomyces elasticus]|nr:hypothetical protein LTR56_027936 [Elasticomyces elasticus]KAK4902467.1 hypothetical protein LTR49_027015 [Elasticomyces elasticus]KAK5736968.1 hypothetical protein LTS12_026027 [Elasticomyces elasticus]